MTFVNNSHSNENSPMLKEEILPVKNGDYFMIPCSEEDMDPKVKPLELEEGKKPSDEESELCGWRSCQPQICQVFRRPGWMLFWLCWAGAIQGMVVNGFVNVVISTVERRYDMSSTESGIIASSYDIASVLCLIPVSYFGGLGCKPRYLGIGVFIMAIGSFVFSIPKFTAAEYEIISSGDLCHLSNNRSTECDNKIDSLSSYKWVFYLGQFLHGAGAAPLYTLGVTYLDENLPLRSSSMYIGIFYAFAIVGPAIGYLAGGAFLNLYVDFDSVSTTSLSINSLSPRWVGAWWVGFLLSGILALMISIPICGFPTSLPGSEKYKAEKEKEVYSSNTKKVATTEIVPGTKGKLLHVWSAVKVLLTNPTFMCLNLAAAAEGNILAGFATFAPKFIEYQFALQSSTAAMYIGYVAVPCGGGGTFLGGYLVKRFNLGIKGIIGLCLGVTLPCFACVLIFLINCENVPFAGVNIPYPKALNGSTKMEFLGIFMTDSCSDNCHCSTEDFNPVCGDNNVVYYSPCYAGCQNLIPDSNPQQYANCSCISTEPSGMHATMGKCGASCTYLPIFLPVFALVMLLTFVASMPALTATLRCVPQKERSFALGIQWIIARCLGSIPGPILFGKLIDITCKLWQDSCGEDGSCFIYDNRSMSHNMLAVALSGKFLSSLFFFLAFIFYKTSPCDVNSNSTMIDKTKPNGSTNHNSNKNSGDKILKDDPQGDKSIETSLNKLGNGDVKKNGNGLNQNGQNESTDF
ncbi:solute carrier organic anion transporter family member 4A1-like isoform X3 [Mytilus galloprovincialis]|uniref:solute carrier organic anion transporter family member 4A1-like isoform X3 n=1 Tax=Mytilus galloprovincialis TaxID=29158 RepID=UPI003F7C86A1